MVYINLHTSIYHSSDFKGKSSFAIKCSATVQIYCHQFPHVCPLYVMGFDRRQSGISKFNQEKWTTGRAMAGRQALPTPAQPPLQSPQVLKFRPS